jgi:hypothetical protein
MFVVGGDKKRAGESLRNAKTINGSSMSTLFLKKNIKNRFSLLGEERDQQPI